MTEPASSLPPLGTILESIFQDAPEHFVVLDPELKVSIAGETFRKSTGIESGGRRSFLDTIEQFSLSKAREVFESLRQGGGEHRSLDLNHRRIDGKTFNVSYSWVACMDESGACRAFVGIGRERNPEAASTDEVGELKSELERTRSDMERRVKEIGRLRHQLENQSSRDEATGLGNRRYILERLEGELDRSQRYNEPLTLLLCDIDNLTQVNEEYGQDRGDEVIQRVAGVVRDQVRTSDVAARYNGEEFLILCPHTDRANAQFLAERLRRRVSEISYPDDEGGEFGVTISVGLVAVNGQNEFGVEAVLRAVEQALESAKHGGMNRVSLVEVS
jgi:diguanylate cyclase (GGDEF)-like protein